MSPLWGSVPDRFLFPDEIAGNENLSGKKQIDDLYREGCFKKNPGCIQDTEKTGVAVI